MSSLDRKEPKKEKQSKNKQKNGVQKKKTRSKPQDLMNHINHLQRVSRLAAENSEGVLSSNYGTTIKAMAKKCVLRLEPAIKRKFCKQCSAYMNPGTTCDIEVVDVKGQHSFIRSVCRVCRCEGKFILNPSHKFWNDMPEFVKQTHQKRLQDCPSGSPVCSRITENLREVALKVESNAS